MPDREKVMKELEKLTSPAFTRDLPCNQQLFRDALALLKAHEPVEPRVGHDGWYRCGGCNNPLASGERVKHFYGHPWPKYCEECGRAVKWE